MFKWKCQYFLISPWIHWLLYSLKASHWDALNWYPQDMSLNWNNEKMAILIIFSASVMLVFKLIFLLCIFLCTWGATVFSLMRALCITFFKTYTLDTVWILISWLQQMPAYQDPHCFLFTQWIHIYNEIAPLNWLEINLHGVNNT